jgi:hypothetical protein
MTVRPMASLLVIFVLAFIAVSLIADLLTPGGFNVGETIAGFFRKTCSSGTATATVPVIFRNYKVYATLGSADSWAKIVIKNYKGSTLDTLIINQRETKYSYVAKLFITVNKVYALQDGTIVGVNLKVCS